MGYTTNTLSLSYQTIEGGTKRWLYTSADSIATILGAGYITDADKKRMQVGDIVDVLSGTLNTSGLTEGAAAFGNTVGLESPFTAEPIYEQMIVASIASGAATLGTKGGSAITDNSGGTANAATGVVANLAKSVLVLPVQLADLAAGDFRIGVPFAFTLSSFLFRTGKPASTAAKAATLTADVNGSAVTGGVANLTTANQNTIGGTVAASAITALNTGAAGQTVGVTASAVTAFVEGDGFVEFTVVNTDLANAIATLIKF